MEWVFADPAKRTARGQADALERAAATDLLDVEVVVATGHKPPAIRRVVYPAGERP